MNKATIKAASIAANFFLAAITDMRIAEDKNPGYPSGKHRATVRRRSMDLTRALAQLRKHE